MPVIFTATTKPKPGKLHANGWDCHVYHAALQYGKGDNNMKTLDRAACFFRLETMMRQRHYAFLSAMREEYGVAGNVLSGGHYPHWPDNVKRKSRRMNRAFNRLCDAGFNCRPRYMRLDTMRKLRLDTVSRTVSAR